MIPNSIFPSQPLFWAEGPFILLPLRILPIRISNITYPRQKSTLKSSPLAFSVLQMEPTGSENGAGVTSHSSLSSPQFTRYEILSTLPLSNLLVCPLFSVHWGGLVQAFISSCLGCSHKRPPNLFLCLWSSLPPILGEDFTDCPETRGWHEKSTVWWFSTYKIKKLSRWDLRLFYQLTKLLFPFWTPSPSVSVMGFLLLFPAMVYPPVIFWELGS